MKRMLFALAGLVVSGLGLIATSAKSDEASWGCQVLLCAASQNPSWHGVGYCVPPMTKLIAAMKKPGFSWPVCHEANAGRPGHEVYEECPTGTTVGYGALSAKGWQGEPDQCIKSVNVCHSRADRNTNMQVPSTSIRDEYANNGCVQQIVTPRPLRADPYYFDIPNEEGVKQRVWFNLND